MIVLLQQTFLDLHINFLESNIRWVGFKESHDHIVGYEILPT